MSTQALPSDIGASPQTSNHARSARRTTWLVAGLSIAALGLAALYMSHGRGPGLSGRGLEALPGLFVRAAAIAIFGVTYLVIAIGRLPGLRLDRAGAALIGASLMVALGVLPLEEAYKAIDFDTITLLLGMMLVVAHLRLAGFFRLVNGWVATRARYPIVLLIAITLATGLLSAFLVNDTVCLVMTPLVLDLVIRLRRNPVPYLLALAMASNIGSLATITGNPQNMIIGSLSHIPYGTFAVTLSPVAGIGLVMTVALIALVYRSEFWTRAALQAEPQPARCHRPMILKSVVVLVAVLAGFFAGATPATVAVTGGSLLLLTRRLKPDKVYGEIDWPLLLMFAGLFVVVSGLERNVLSPAAIAGIGTLHLERLPVLTVVTAALSNLVSNVPAVLALKHFVAAFHDPQRAWLVIAMASTLAGNFTVLGSIANLVVVQRARAEGVEVGFFEYFKIGAPLTVLTLVVGVVWLAWA
jgi:Na+/H+ antiporter NhaD/arsenite permease-like protein